MSEELPKFEYGDYKVGDTEENKGRKRIKDLYGTKDIEGEDIHLDLAMAENEKRTRAIERALGRQTISQNLKESLSRISQKGGAQFINEEKKNNPELVEFLKELGEDANELVDKELIIKETKKELTQAEKEKWIDDLTGLKNKNAYIGNMPNILNKEKRDQKECSVLVLDIDNFKSINDTYGHLAGDQAIEQLAKEITKHIRQSDYAFRFGGDEIVIALLDTDTEGAQIVAEKIREFFESYEFKVIDNNGEAQKIKSTVSIGCKSTGEIKQVTEEYIEELVRNADKALYISKNAGKNKITVWSEELEKTDNSEKSE